MGCIRRFKLKSSFTFSLLSFTHLSLILAFDLSLLFRTLFHLALFSRHNFSKCRGTTRSKILNFLTMSYQFANMSPIHTSINDKPKKPFSLKDIYDSSYEPSDFNGTWISDTEILIKDEIRGIVTLYDVRTRQSEVIFNYDILPMKYRDKTSIFSANRKYVLLCDRASNGLWKSTIGKCHVVYNVKTSKIVPIKKKRPMTIAVWSPVHNDLVYVYKGDIYYMRFNNSAASERRLTTTGIRGIIFNGIPDIIYMKEVFKSNTALWFSPDGRYLAFATFNDSKVQDVPLLNYGLLGSFEYQDYAEIRVRYPKVGTPNPVVSLSVIDLFDLSSKAVVLEVPVDRISSEYILSNVNWWNSSHVIARWTNRYQAETIIVTYDTQGASERIFFATEPLNWVETGNIVRFGDYALLLQWQNFVPRSNKFRHITRYEYKYGQLIFPVDLTRGPSEVHSILDVDFARDMIYYLATAPGEPTQRNLYSVQGDGLEKPTCISCQRLTPEGNRCTYANAYFSTSKSYYALTCLGPDPFTVTIYDKDHQHVLTWEDNHELRKNLSGLLMPLQREVNVSVNGYVSRVRLLLPPDFNKTESYPMVVNVYGAPDTTTISDMFMYGYEYYLTTNRRIIYAWIDGRGSANKGSNMLFEIYRCLGTVEVKDTIDVTSALQERYNWIDANRTGIWGNNYGGFVTGMVLATDFYSVFKCGISVSPITSWMYYNSIYTERYMGTPTVTDNLDYYNYIDFTRQAENLLTKKYMIAHGNTDLDSLYNQTMLVAESLKRRNTLFKHVIFQDEGTEPLHVKPDLYRKMDKFWTECFHLDPTATSSRREV